VKNQGIIPVVFSTNEYFVPYMSASMQSIMENAGKNRQYIFYVLYKSIVKETIGLLQRQISYFHQFSIKFIDVTKFIEGYDFFISRHISVETYFRLLIPELLSEYNKVIYVDGDMICLTDIALLFDIDIENYLLAAVPDIDIVQADSLLISKNHKFIHELKYPNDYFNAGLIIFNIEKIRRSFTIQYIMNLAASREHQCHDQDVLNILANEDKLLLPIAWNFMPIDKRKINPSPLCGEYFDAFRDHFIIHYKPWQDRRLLFFFDEFWKYATRTPFVKIITKRMEEKELISSDAGIQNEVLDNIKRRKGIGLRFILFNCVKAWITRERKS
jgi:lipopolysaccharide biosynthesis glycosyltransferase